MRTKTISITALVLVLLLLSLSVASAAPPSPFTGHWRAVDLDNSNVQLSISGGGNGIYRLTQTDDDWGLCNGAPGIGRGVGTLHATEPILHTDLVFYCPSQHIEVGFPFDFVYDADTDTLFQDYDHVQADGSITWDRVGP